MSEGTPVIVVGVVPGEQGKAALAEGVRQAEAHGGRVLAVNTQRGGTRLDSHQEQEIEQMMQRARAILAEAGVPAEVKEFVLGTPPAQQLLDVASAHGATMIVIGIRRRSAVGKLLLGSNAQHILMHADCPVLAVKPV